MFKHLTKTVLLLVIPAAGSVAFAQNASEVHPIWSDRQIISNPRVEPPREAVETGLGGVVSVPVTVDAMGNVVEVGNASGPGSVCRQVTRPDVVEMRSVATEAAKLAKFAPIKAGEPELSRFWVRFDFPSSGKVAQYDASPVGNEPEADTPEKSPKDSKKYTVKGDQNYSAANAPPPDYKGPVNTTGSGADAPLSASDPPLTEYTVTGKQISGGVLNGKANSLPKPPYPPAARAVRAAGAVSIQVLIDTGGEVFSAQAVSGHPLLRSAAVTAACGATFSPTSLEGKPVKVSGVITYNFVP